MGQGPHQCSPYDYINHRQTVAAAIGVSQVMLQSHETGSGSRSGGGRGEGAPLGKFDDALSILMRANVQASFDP